MDRLQERREERRERDRSGLLIGLAISLLAHLALVPPLLGLIRTEGAPRQHSADVRLVRVTRSAWLQNRQIQAGQAPEQRRQDPDRPDPTEDEDDPLQAPGQVVALPPPEQSQRPDRADYASEHDRRVERESRSRFQTADFLNPAHRIQAGDPERRDAPSASEPQQAPVIVRAEQPGGPEGPGRAREGQGPVPEGEGGAPTQAEIAIPRLAQRDALDLKVVPDQGEFSNRSYSDKLDGNGSRLALRLGPLASQASRVREQAGVEGRQGGGGNDRPGFAALTPDLRTLERLSGAPANDHLPDVEEDEATFLNTWRWKHAPFFNRIAESIRREWRPGPEIARRDPTGNIYGFQDRYTLLRVTIDQTGGIREVVVSESCGVDFLDREAVHAFRRAQPFSNPPSRLFAGGDTYTFHFGFNVDFQTSPMVRFNWRAMP